MTVSEEIRIYSNEELDLRNKGLQEAKIVLNDVGLECILILGVLLGAYRESNFIKWDWDVELAVFSEDVFPKYKNLEKIALSKGFDVDKVNISETYFKVHLIKYNNKYTLLGFDKIGEMRESKMLKVPINFFRELSDISFRGEIYKAPTDIEGYLVHTYGNNWKTPIKTYDKDVYFRKETLIRDSFLSRLINKIIRFVKR